MWKKKECACEPSGGELAVKAAMEVELSGKARMVILPSPKLVRPYGYV